MERTILHCDMNGFYASVEIMNHPSLRGRPMAVCGATETRHGIVLAKSEEAKKAGVKTGMVNWEAKQLCPTITFVSPHYEQYIKYSRMARAIYEEYTDLVEPYGMDECFLDVTGSLQTFGSGEALSNELRRRMREELGLTISVGVSYNKVFAKLGSDMKKPDAVTCLPKEEIGTRIWPLPVESLLYCGRATTAKLRRYSIYTIGDLAKMDRSFIKRLLGKNGLLIQRYAQGLDDSPVRHRAYESPIKSVGHGITCTVNLETLEEVWRVLLELSQDVGHRLRVHGLKAKGVQIGIRYPDLRSEQRQGQLSIPTRAPIEIARKGQHMFETLWQEQKGATLPVRALTVRAIQLVDHKEPQQVGLFDDYKEAEREDKLFDTVDELRKRFGKEILRPAVLLTEDKIPTYRDHDLTLPGIM